MLTECIQSHGIYFQLGEKLCEKPTAGSYKRQHQSSPGFLTWGTDIPPQLQQYSCTDDAIKANFEIERNYDHNAIIFILGSFHGKAL